MILCLQSLASFCQFVFKILSKNQILTSIKGRNSVAKLRKSMIYNTNVDLVNDNVYTKFGLNRSIRFQDIYSLMRLSSSKKCNYTHFTITKDNHEKWLRDGSLQNQFLPGRFLRDFSLKISNGTVRSKVVGRFAPKQIYGRFTHFHNIHVYSLKMKFGSRYC